MPNVTLHFNHKLTGADFNKKTAWFEEQSRRKMTDHAQNATQDGVGDMEPERPKEFEVKFDLLIGADGAHSAVRHHMMKHARVNYTQEYIDTLWCEFQIKPKSPDTSFAIDPNHLHIWPAGSFMFIAIPSLDKSFTCTLFAPASHFSSISANPQQRLPKFFHKYFPGVTPDLIPPIELLNQFHENPHLPLISIKCRPYHYKSSVVILGDAAHAMVPFYGQGMNAGLEDVRVLFGILDRQGVYDHYDMTEKKARTQAREAALDAYTTQRAPDAAAINDLALRNYEEMRSSVQSPLYKVRKWMEETLMIYVPSLGWRTQYTRVSFENQRYSEVEKAVQRQGRILKGVLAVSFMGIGCLAAFGLMKRGSVMHLKDSLLRLRR
jgi:kynurenine 3-monooxygenase